MIEDGDDVGVVGVNVGCVGSMVGSSVYSNYSYVLKSKDVCIDKRVGNNEGVSVFDVGDFVGDGVGRWQVMSIKDILSLTS